MFLVTVALVVVTVVFGPQAWAKRVLERHNSLRDDLQGSGVELAEHLVDGIEELDGVEVEVIDGPSHYDPNEKKIRLERQMCQRKSLTSLVVATHEVGHAIQDASGYQPLLARTRLVRASQNFQRTGGFLLMAVPIVAIIGRMPRLLALMIPLGLGVMGISVVIHLVTLPVEWDASFKRALPLLDANDFVLRRDLRASRQILTACALTYVAASLASLLNLWRWIALVRR